MWFGRDLSQYQVFLMPIAFLHGIAPGQAVVANTEERRVLEYVRSLENGLDDRPTNDFNLAINVDIRVRRVADAEATKVVLSNAPDAVPVALREEDIRERYPWDYAILTRQLRSRYADFIENNDYHQQRRALEGDECFCRPRFLDPGNPRSAKKNFYSPNVLREFDKHYQRRAAAAAPVAPAPAVANA
jgi:hypothetical protein